MTTQRIGESEIFTGRLSYGCMRISGSWDPSKVTAEMRENGKKAVLAAYEAGYTLFDHADIYARGECEKIHGELMKEIPSMRENIIIATKCGIRFPGDPEPSSPHRYDFSAEHILASCDKSLERLGIDVIDIYQLHRPDLLMNPDEVAEAFGVLKKAGKVRYFGVSNFLPSFVDALQAALDEPLIVNQVEISLTRLDCFYDGTLDQCLKDDITPLSWSPLGGGALGTGAEVPAADHKNYEMLSKLLPLLDEIGKKYGVSRTVVALSWLLSHPSGIIPIVGSANPANIRDAAAADEIELEREDWYRILVAARNAPLP